MTALRLPDISNETAIVQSNAHMPHGDPEFCLWVLNQLPTAGVYHMAEPFDSLIGQVNIDIRRLKQNIINGVYVNAAEFESEFTRLVNECRSVFDQGSKEQQKACDLTLKLLELFKGRRRFDGRLAKKQAQTAAATAAAAAVTANSAPPPTVNTQTRPPGIGQGQTATPAAATNPARLKLAIRTPTPGPSRTTDNRFEGRANQGQRSEAGPVDHGTDFEDALRPFDEEAPGYGSALQTARSGKRAASPHDDGPRLKQARQDPKDVVYRDLRVTIAEMVDQVMEGAYQRGSNIKLNEEAHRYLEHLSQKSADDARMEKRTNLNELKVDCAGKVVPYLLEFVHTEVNDLFVRRAEGIPRRMSAPASMEDIRTEPRPKVDVKRESRR